jgi:hypothetical protein
MSVKQYLTSGDHTKIKEAIDKNKPMSMEKQKMVEKQERMFYDLNKDVDFQKEISGLKRMGKTVAIQKKYVQNGVNITKREIDKMMKNGVTIVKLSSISMPKLIAKSVVIPKQSLKVVSIPKEPISKVKPTTEEVDITVDNILDYQIYDVNGFVGAFATTSDLKQFREFAFKLDGGIALKELLEAGASLITQELMDDIFMVKSDNRTVQKIIIILQTLIDKADTMVIISDGE